MLRTTSISLTYKEMRRDRRYALPPVAVTLGDTQYPARNWSLGGLLLERRRRSQSAGGSPASSGSPTGWRVRDHGRGGAARQGCRPPRLPLHRAVAGYGGRARRRRGRTLLAPPSCAPGGAGGCASRRAAACGGAGRRRRIGRARARQRAAAGVPSRFPQSPARAARAAARRGGSADFARLARPRRHQFLFSPRSRFGLEQDSSTGTSRSYAGLSWNLFDSNGFYSNLGIAGSVTRPGPEEMYRRALGPTVGLHSSSSSAISSATGTA